MYFGPEPSSGQNPQIAISMACRRLGDTDHTKLFLEATHGLPKSPIVAARWIDAAIVAEVQAVREAAYWRN